MKILFRHIILIIFAVSSFLIANAQDDDGLGTEQIEIVKDYNPFIADAVKINFPASLPPYEPEKLELIYTVPVKLMPVSFTPASLRPVAIAREKPKFYSSNYIKAGFGTQLTPFIEAIYNDGKFDKYNYGAYFRHISSRAKKIDNQDISNTDVSVFGDYYFKKAKVHSEINYGRDAFFYYGYNHSDTSFTKKQVKKQFNDIEWKTSASNIGTKKGLDIQGDFVFNYFNNVNNIKESTFTVSLGAEKIFKEKHYMRFNIYEDYIAIKNDTNKYTNNIFGVKPVYEFNDHKWRIFAGADLVWESGVFHAFPDLGLERSLFEQYIILYNGWKMELQKNSYKSFIKTNPWLRQQFEVRNTWFEDRYIGLKGTVNNFTYNARFAQRVIRKLPVYANDSTDMKQFELSYESKPFTLNLHTEFGYRVNSDLDVNLTLEYFNYEDFKSTPWHLPNFFMNIDARYLIKKKALLTFGFYVIDGVTARERDGSNVKLKGTADINIGANYKFNKYLSFFCNLNNLASVKHQQYYKYPSYGFNMLAGVTFTY